MNSNFIPALHFEPAEKKLTNEWWKKAVDYYWSNSNVRSLLDGKNIQEIEEYFTGDIDMKPFRGMYKSMKRKWEREQIQKAQGQSRKDIDIDKIIFQTEPLIPNKVNSAIAIIEKIPLEVVCTANDALAMKKKKEDIDFLKNKAKLEDDLQEFADEMGIGKVDLGSTKHSYTKFSNDPAGFDLSDPEQEKMFADLAYALRVEVANEKALQGIYDLKNIKNIRLLETVNHFKYGVSCNGAFQSSTTGLPDVRYIHPGSVYTQHSELPDYSDNTARFIAERMSVMDMFNMFGNDIKNEQDLWNIINGREKGSSFLS